MHWELGIQGVEAENAGEAVLLALIDEVLAALNQGEQTYTAVDRTHRLGAILVIGGGVVPPSIHLAVAILDGDPLQTLARKFGTPLKDGDYVLTTGRQVPLRQIPDTLA